MDMSTAPARLIAAISVTLLPVAGLMSSGTALAITANSVGVVSGKSDDATRNANTAALKKLVSPAGYGGPAQNTGSGNFSLTFPDGAVYYFNDVIAFMDNISVDLMGSTLSFSKNCAATPTDPNPCVTNDGNAGFIIALRGFSISNGTIQVVDNNGPYVAPENPLQFGQRSSSGGKYFQPPPVNSNGQPVSGGSFYECDSLPFGNITVNNLHIISNSVNGQPGLNMFGGLQNVQISNLSIDGQGALIQGISYEFAWAAPVTGPPPADCSQLLPAALITYSTTGQPIASGQPPYSTHAHGMTLSNISIANLNPNAPIPPKKKQPDATIALALGGAYNTLVNGLTVTGVVDDVIAGSGGEAAFYNMWQPVSAPNRTITLQNITALQVRAAGVGLGGAGVFAGGGYLATYLLPSSYTDEDQRDELNYVLNGFNLAAVPGTLPTGIPATARSINVSNGTLSGFEDGVGVTQDCTMISIDNITVLNSARIGINLGVYAGIDLNNPRNKSGYVKDSVVAGSGSGASHLGNAGIDLNWVGSFTIENNTLKAANGSGPATQGAGIQLETNVSNVLAHDNYVVSVYASTPAYVNNSTTSGNTDTIQGARGITTSQGLWTTSADVWHPGPAINAINGALLLN